MVYTIFEKETRPVNTWKMIRELTAWFCLNLQPLKFDIELCDDIISTYFLKVRIRDMDKENALTDKQYSLLYNIYDKYFVSKVFKNIYDEVKFVCINVKKIENCDLEYDETHIPVMGYYFELQDGSILSPSVFETKYSNLLLHNKYKKLSQATSTDFE